MTAARRDNDGGACGLLFRRQVRRDRRLVNVRHDALAVLGKPHRFRPGLAFGAGSAIWPERNLLRLVGRQHRGGRQRQGEKRASEQSVFHFGYLDRIATPQGRSPTLIFAVTLSAAASTTETSFEGPLAV